MVLFYNELECYIDSSNPTFAILREVDNKKKHSNNTFMILV